MPGLLSALLRRLAVLAVLVAVGGCSYWREVSQAVWPDDTTESDEIAADEQVDAQAPDEMTRDETGPDETGPDEMTPDEMTMAEAPQQEETFALPMPRPATAGSALLFPPAVEVADTGTFTAGVTANIRSDLSNMQGALQAHGDEAAATAAELQSLGENFYGLAAAMEARLQSGTTASNPILVEQWNEARYHLDQASVALSRLGQIRNNAATDAGIGGFLMENADQALKLPGSVELDKEQLEHLRIEIGGTILVADDLVFRLNEDVRRHTAFLHNGERTLSLLARAVRDGAPYGRRLDAALVVEKVTVAARPAAAPSPPPPPPPAPEAQPAVFGDGEALLIIVPSEETSETASMQALYDVVSGIDYRVDKFEVRSLVSKDFQPSVTMEVLNRAKRTASALADFGINADRIFVATKYVEVPKGEIHIIAHR